MGGQTGDQTIRSTVGDTNSDKLLRLLSINVCGLKSKLIIPEFQSLIQGYDIIGVQETKCDDYDSLVLSEYIFHVKNRKHFMKRKSGGIAIAYRKCLDHYITPTCVESKSKLVL